MDLMTLKMVLVVFGAMFLLMTQFFLVTAFYGVKFYFFIKKEIRKERKEDKPPK